MKSTSEKFDILVSKIKRHERACKDNDENDINHNLSNVTIGDTSVSIKTKSGEIIKLYGNKIQFNENTVLYSEIVNTEWITPDTGGIEKARYKAQKFDNFYIYYPDGRMDLVGVGQAVFPIMSFVGWAHDK